VCVQEANLGKVAKSCTVQIKGSIFLKINPHICPEYGLKTFIQQGSIKRIKSEKDIYNFTKVFLYKVNTVPLNLLFISILKCITVFHKNMKRHNCFNIDNDKSTEQQLNILE